jgi:phage RecT family recombinase
MSNEKLTLTRKALMDPPDLRGMFEVDAFRANFVDNFAKTTGRNNGLMVFERERVLFMKALQENPKLEKCDRFTLYSSMIELAVSGLSLSEGMSYIIPYNDKAQFQIGWKGRLEQISNMPHINYIPEPQVVYASELNDFEYTLGDNPRIIKHKPSVNRGAAGDELMFVYLVLDTKFGKQTFIMTREEVHGIRDRYSKPYINYVAKGGKWPDGKPMDPPFWVTSPAQAWKKTIVKRVYNMQPKSGRLKALDSKLKGHFDPEDETIEETHDIDYGLTNEPATTSEVHEPTVTNTETKKRTTRTKTSAPAETIHTTAQSGKDTVDTSTGEVLNTENPVESLPDLKSAIDALDGL